MKLERTSRTNKPLLKSNVMRKKIVLLTSALLFGATVFAQNLQTHYDFGHNFDDAALENRAPFTTTVEMFKPDSWGSTFFFVDMDYDDGVKGAYWEIARELCFWQESSLNWLSAHVEYNGGLNVGMSFNNAYLLGATYSGHTADFSKTWSLSVMYKNIPNTRNDKGELCEHNFQLTGVWGMNLLDNWLTFSGFIDFWSEARPWQDTKFILLSEPQLWVNLNKISAMEKVNLSVGGEIEISNNFVSEGFYVVPTIAAKWTF